MSGLHALASNLFHIFHGKIHLFCTPSVERLKYPTNMTFITTNIAIDELDLSSLADALHASTEYIDGPLADKPAIQKFLHSVPNATIAQLAVVRATCIEHPDAVQDVKRLEQELRAELHEFGMKEHAQKSIEPELVLFPLSAYLSSLTVRSPVYTELVGVYTGSAKNPFMVHEWYINKTPYFAARLESAVPDGKANTLHLLDDSAEAFQRVLDFAYMGKLTEKLISHYGVHNGSELGAETLLGMETYLLGIKLGMEQFANGMIDQLRRSYKRMIPCEKEVKLALRKGNNQLKDLLLRKTAHGISRHGWDVYLNVSSADRGTVFSGNGDWAEQLVKILAKYPNPTNPVDEADGCQWHVHVHTPKCRQDMPFPALVPSVLRHEGGT